MWHNGAHITFYIIYIYFAYIHKTQILALKKTSLLDSVTVSLHFFIEENRKGNFMEEQKEQEQYFGVIYQTDEYKNTIILLPRKTKEQCLEVLRKCRDKPEMQDRIKATTVIKRNMVNFKNGMIFGYAKSLDVMQEKPKRRKNED